MEEIINEEVKTSSKDMVLERLQKMFPDVDEETMYAKFMEFMDDMERASAAHAELGQKLTKHPKAALMLADMMDGAHPAVAMKRRFQDDELSVDEGTEEYEALLNAERERLADEEASGQMQAEYQSNLQASASDVQAFKDGKNLTDEQFAEFLETCIELTGDLLSGKLNKDLLDILWKGRNYDTDMANETALAEDRGSIRERNKKIEAEKVRMKGDGLPLAQSSAVKDTKTNIPYRKSVWDK